MLLNDSIQEHPINKQFDMEKIIFYRFLRQATNYGLLMGMQQERYCRILLSPVFEVDGKI